jgi:fructosamine-3-kinase
MELPIHVQISLHEQGLLQLLTNIPATPVSGGMVAQSARVETGQGPVFVKWKEDAPERFFLCEAEGLQQLANSKTLRVPKVLVAYDASPDDVTVGWQSVLALEWIEERRPTSPEAFATTFAEQLAALHRENTAPEGLFGLEVANFLGSQPQDNTWTHSWAEFYRDRRVLLQMEIARMRGHLPAHRERLVRDVCDKMEDLLDGLDSRPCMVHGDLWSGNYMTAGDEPVLIDPAVYYAEREVELAFIELFGGFPEGFKAAYEDAFPLQEGYEYRRPLHQLYPLLVHLNHFGETYGPAVDGACRFYLS